VVLASLLVVTVTAARAQALAQSAGQLPGQWEDAVGSLADKISAALPPRPISIELRNISSISPADATSIERRLESELRHRGFEPAKAASPDARIRITVSEGTEAYLWVADVPTSGADQIVIVAADHRRGSTSSAEPAPALRARPLLHQPEPILDFAQATGPDGLPLLFILETNRLVRLQLHAGTWESQGSLPILETRLWPRDLRGHLVVSLVKGIEVFLPGVSCTAPLDTPVSLDCAEKPDASWPVGDENDFSFASDRNYFSGFSRDMGVSRSGWPRSYSIASGLTAGSRRWVLAELDGRAELLDDTQRALSAFPGWGDQLVSIAPGCEAGWQVLVSGTGDWTEPDHLQIYQIGGDQAVARGQPLEFPGPISALWPSDDGKSARVVSRNLKTGFYEASSVSVSCDN
jgi:hypothetical protein